MRPNNLIDFRKISNITSSNKEVIAQSTKMDFDENTYKNELWNIQKIHGKNLKDQKQVIFLYLSIPIIKN